METINNITFKPFETTTCAEVPIVDDNNQELPENFVVGFDSGQPRPGVRAGIISVTTITIIDDDIPGSYS